MPPVLREQIEQIKSRVLAEWLQEVRKKGPAVSVETLSEEPDIDPRLSVGYIFDRAEQQFTLQIRVQADAGPAFEAAQKAKKMAAEQGARADIAVTESAQMPGPRDITDAERYPALCVQKDELHIGLSIGHPDGRSGTLGLFVEGRDGIGILSC